ncbi:hypothetical protein JOF28_001973 [Leucobacter exalbidus]|uniref:Uncharacterized protein n=1 Tax=Leucobacter exalbidus TaxID=662960 RepID=A0A940PZ13_9MICO|nr:hypothetical protein [Leucobacter exalbidus]MBP1326741.1 hypothetical protein [Leucobacter exalbidus]
MTAKEIIRLAIYGLAAVTAAVLAILAYLRGDTATVTVALGWIATNVLSVFNVGNTSTGGDHAA